MRFVFPISTSAIAVVTVVSAASLLLVRRFQKKKNKEKHKKSLRNERPVKPILTDESADQEMAPPRPSSGKSKKRRRKRNYASPRPSVVEETEPLPVIPVPPIEEAKSPFLIRALRDIHQKLTNISRSLSIRVRQWTILSDTEWSISDEEQAEGAEELSEPEDSGILVQKSEPEDDISLTAIPSSSVSDSRPSSKTQLETTSPTTSICDSQKPSTATPRRTLSDLEESWSECITGSTEGSESDEVFHDAETSEIVVPVQEQPKISVVSFVEEKNDIKKAAEEIRAREEKLLTGFEEVLQLQQTKVWEAEKDSSPDIPVFDWERELVMELERLSSEKNKHVEIPESPSKALITTLKEVQEPSAEVKAEEELVKAEQRKPETPITEEVTKLETVEEEVIPKDEKVTKIIVKDDSTQSQQNVPETYQMLTEAEEAIQSSNSVSIRGVEEVIEEEPEESEEDLPLICLDSESDLNSRGSSSPMSDVVFEQQKPLLHIEDEKNKLADLEDDPDYKELLDQESDYNRQQLEAANAIVDDAIEQFDERKLIETTDMAEVTDDKIISEDEMDTPKTEVPEFIGKTIGSWSEEVITEGIVQAAKLIADTVVEMDEKQDSESLTEVFSQELAKRILVESFPEACIQVQSIQSSDGTELDGNTCLFQDFVAKLSEEIARIAVAETIAAAKLRKEITIHEYEKEFGTRIIDEIFNQIFNKTLLKEKESTEVCTDLEELPSADQTAIDLEEVSLTDKEEDVVESIIHEEKKESEELPLQKQKDAKKKEVFKPDSKEAVIEKEDGIVSWLHKRTDSLLQQEKPTRQYHAMKKLSLSQIPKPVSSTIRGKSPQQQRRVSEPPEPKKRLSLQSNQPSTDVSVIRRQSAPAKHIQPVNRISDTAKKPAVKPERTKSPMSVLKTRSVDVPSHVVNKPSIPPRRSLQVTPRERKHGVFGVPIQPSSAELSQSKGKYVPQAPSKSPSQPSTKPTTRKKNDSKVLQSRKTVPTTKSQPKPAVVQQSRLRQSTEAFVTLATNDSYALGALVLAKSLQATKTARHLVILTTDGISSYMRQLLIKVFDVVINVTRLEFSGAALELLDRPELGVTLTKLHCWKLTQYKKCVFLDADLLVLQNCDELFERAELSAVPDVGWPDCFNSGVFVFVPSLETYWGLVNLFKEKGSFDGGDQGLLNWYFGNNWKSNIGKRLPFIYNVVATSTYTYAPAFQRFGEGAKIVHFLGATKPWHVNWSTESRYILEDSKINRTFLPYMQKWLNIFFDEVFPQLPKAYKDRLHHKHSTSVKDLTSRSNKMDTSPQPSPHTPRSSPHSTNTPRSPHTISASPHQTEHIHHEEHPPEVIHHYQPPSESPKQTDNQLSSSFTSLEVHGFDNMENRSESLTARSDSQRSSVSGMSSSSLQQVASAVTESTDFVLDYKEESLKTPSESTEERQDSSIDYSSSLFQDDDLEELEEPETEEVRQAAWEEYKMDYLGKDRFDNILRHLDTMMGVEPLENETTDIPDEDKESETYEKDSSVSGSDTSSQNPGSMQTPEPSFATGDYKRMHDWEQGRIDYTGRDSSDNIMRRLDFLLCNDNPLNSK